MNDAPKKSKKELHREAYGKAMSRLRDARQEEFNKYRTEEAKLRGLDWSPKPTEAEKAREQLALILRDYPHLADEFTQDTPEAAKFDEAVNPEGSGVVQ